MKKLILTHLFLNLYILAIIQPALPIVEYLINYDYIVEQLCENRDKPILTCNGKCYLGDQVEKQLNLTHDNEKPLPPTIEYDKLLSLKEIVSFSLCFLELSVIDKPIFGETLVEKEFYSLLLRPPII